MVLAAISVIGHDGLVISRRKDISSVDNRLQQHFSDIYLPGRSAADYLSECRAKHLVLDERLSLGRMLADILIVTWPHRGPTMRNER